MYYQLTDAFEVSASAEDVWAFFSRAENLPDITPPGLGFRVVTPAPVTIANDALIDYTIKPVGWLRVRLRWRTRIIDWSPPRQFIDLQLRGPYALWHHQHTFAATERGTVECRDRVLYKLPMGWVGRAVHAMGVKRQLLQIFRFRRKVIAERLGWVRALQADVEIARV
ncbi:MAG TPA: SRPBCC family protein [Tepidisphaeraceae bacterium]|nr:SRPBCC family protein [Tepidisphaeraceae bacterium]